MLTAQGVPVVGDYDLLGFLPLESPGRNIALVPENPETGDWIGPDVKRYAKALNAKLDMPRIMHGAMEGLKSKQYPGFIEEITYAVFPDGHSYVMEGKAAAEDFYKLFGRDAARWHAEVVPRALGFPDLEVLNGGKK